MKKPVIVAGLVLLAGIATGIWGFLQSPATVAAAVNSGDGYRKVSAAGIDFEWKIEGSNLHVKLKAKTKGWVAVGFNPSTKMKGANFIVGYVKNGKPILADEFGTGFFSHKSDKSMGTKDNLTNKQGSESGGFTQLGFTIPLNSGDKHDSVLVPGKSVKLLLAHGSDSSDNVSSKHTKRALVTTTL